MERRWIVRAVALAALAVAGAGAAFAATRTASDLVLHGCARQSDGRLRLVAPGAVCRPHEVAVSWNSAGPAGPAGPQGAVGPAGPPGPAGPSGRDGATLTSLEQLDGLACSPGSSTGTVAVSYDAGDDAVISCRIATGTTTTTVATTTTTTTTTTGGGTPLVLVNEVETGTTGSASDEFVELVNAGTAPADLGGYKVVYRSAAGTADVSLATIPAGTTVAPGAHYLLGGSAYAGSRPADQSFSFSLAAAGGGVGLRDGSGALVDSVGYGSATNAFVEGSPAPAAPAADPPGSSIARVPDGHDTGDNGSDFAVGPATPGTANS